MRAGVTGAGGLLAHTLVPRWREAGVDVLPWTRADLDVTRPDDVARVIRETRPDAVVHLAAYTNVDGAEADPESAFRVNRDGTASVAAACRAAGSVCVYVSSDYVLQGRDARAMGVDAPLRPHGVYAQSKAAGEAAVREAGGDWLIARTGWVFGPGGKNFVDTMRLLAAQGRAVRVVDDQHGAPSSTRLIAGVLLRLVTAGCRGVWHIAPAGLATWLDVARAVYGAAGADLALVSPCTTAESGRAAPRPAYSVLDAGATARQLGYPLPAWERDVEAYVRTGTPPASPWEEEHLKGSQR